MITLVQHTAKHAVRKLIYNRVGGRAAGALVPEWSQNHRSLLQIVAHIHEWQIDVS